MLRDHVRPREEEREREHPERDERGGDRALDEALAEVEEPGDLFWRHRVSSCVGEPVVVIVLVAVDGSRDRDPVRTVRRAASRGDGHRRAAVDGVAAEAARRLGSRPTASSKPAWPAAERAGLVRSGAAAGHEAAAARSRREARLHGGVR